MYSDIQWQFIQISSGFDPDLPSPPAARPGTRTHHTPIHTAFPIAPQRPFDCYGSPSPPPEVPLMGSNITCGRGKLGKSRFAERSHEYEMGRGSKCEAAKAAYLVMPRTHASACNTSIAPSGNLLDDSEPVRGSGGAEKMRPNMRHSASVAQKAGCEGGRGDEARRGRVPSQASPHLLRTPPDGGRHLGTCARARK